MSEFKYDYASRRAWTREYDFGNGGWANPVITWHVFAGLNVIQERNVNNQVTAQLVRNGNIGGILSRTTTDGPAFYGYDGNGNVTLLTNSAGQDVGHYRYDAFGNTLEAVGPRADENPYRFSTKELHGPSGLYDFGLRFYSPGMGRWINRDPIQEDGGINLYAMVSNNPISSVDDYGLYRVTGSRYLLRIAGRVVARAAVSAVTAPMAVMLGTLAVTAKPVGDGTLTGSKGYAGPLRPPVVGPPKPGGPPANFPSGSKPHGNTRSADVKTHVYQILYRPRATDDNPGEKWYTWKIGITSGTLEGSQARPNVQVRRLTRDFAKLEFKWRLLRTFDNRDAAREFETNLIRSYRTNFGSFPPGNPVDR